MEYEIELKLLTTERAGELITAQLLPQIDAKVSTQELELSNHYFDTPDRVLKQQKMGLRIRGYHHQFEQTLKTAGHSIGGLHQRPEYNVSLETTKNQTIGLPNLKLFPESVWPDFFDVERSQTQIGVLFTTHFKRKVFLFDFPNCDAVELVWDLGEITANNRTVPICEIELELKSGSIAALFLLAKQVVNLIPTTIGNESKAARGYQLLDDETVKIANEIQFNISKYSEFELEDTLQSLNFALQHFQKLSVEITRHFSLDIVKMLTATLTHIEECVTTLKCNASSQKLEDIQSALLDFIQDWRVVVEQKNNHNCVQLITDSKVTLLQLDMMQYLAEQR